MSFHMKRLLIALFLCLILSNIPAVAQRTMYIAAASGLSLRERGAAEAGVILKIAYGEKVNIDSLINPAIVDGFNTYWAAVNYNGKHGYVLHAHLLPIPPPAKGVDELQKYAEQLSERACKPVVNIEGDTANDDAKIDEKHFYKNGCIYTVHNDYEYLSESLIISDISIQQAFVVAQNIPFFKEFLPVDGRFPDQAHTTKDMKGNYRQTVMQYYESAIGSYKRLKKLQFVVDEPDVDGAFSIIELNGQVIIMYEYGS